MGVKVGLDRAAVVQAAADLADAEGLEAVTIARLAARLGIRPPSLYNHVSGQEGLRHELALCGVQELGRRLGRAVMGKSGDTALLAIADAYRAFAHEHPGLYAASQRAPDPDDPAVVAAAGEVLDAVLAVLAGYDLSGDDALHATRALRSLVHGFVSLEAGGGFGLPLDLDESFRRLLALFIVG